VVGLAEVGCVLICVVATVLQGNDVMDFIGEGNSSLGYAVLAQVVGAH